MRRPVRIVERRVCLARWTGPEMTIAVLSDIHAHRRWMPLARVAELAQQTQALGADMIALLGDYVGHLPLGRPEEPAEVAAALARLTAPLGTWAIFGNHDWYDDPGARSDRIADTRWHRAFRDRGIAVLENACTRLDHGGQAFWLAGLGSQQALKRDRKRTRDGVDDIVATLDGVPEADATILLAHEPDIFPDLPPGVDLTLSGHTHGGQIVIRGFAPVVPSRYGRRYAYGAFSGQTGHLIVTSGVGYSGLPVRIGAPAEIVLVRVRGPE